MPTFARRPLAISSLFPLDVPQNSMFGQQRQHISKLQFGKFPYTFYILMLEDKIQSQVTACSDFPSEAMLTRELLLL